MKPRTSASSACSPAQRPSPPGFFRRKGLRGGFCNHAWSCRPFFLLEAFKPLYPRPTRLSTKSSMLKTRTVLQPPVILREAKDLCTFLLPQEENSGPSPPERLLNSAGNYRRQRLHLLFRLRLHHDSRQSLRTRIPNHHAPVSIQLALRRFDRPLNLGNLRKRDFLPHAHILNLLWKNF